MKTHWIRFSLFVAPVILAAILPDGCTTSPVTGRRHLNLVSAGEETQLGLTSFEQLKTNTPISHDAALNAMVQRVGKRLADVAAKDLPNAQWEFVVFESKEANAFCLPGGKVGVYTGLLPITKDEAGLATVVGHEIGHAVARHGGERMSQELLRQAGSSVVASSLSSADPRWQAAAGTVYGLGTQLGVMLPYSRAQESEADHLGLIYMARAGYDPEAAVGFWQRFGEYTRQAGGGGTPAIFRTHPTDEQRVEQIKEWLPRAKQEYRPQR